MDRGTTAGFYLDWFFQVNNGFLALMLVFVAGTIFIGMFFYITAMVNDMTMRIAAIDDDFNPQRKYEKIIWSIHVREIRFHLEIIE